MNNLYGNDRRVSLNVILLSLAAAVWCGLLQMSRESTPDEEHSAASRGAVDYGRLPAPANTKEGWLPSPLSTDHSRLGIRLAVGKLEDRIPGPVEADQRSSLSKAEPFERVPIATVEGWMRAALKNTYFFEIVESGIGSSVCSEQDCGGIDRFGSSLITESKGLPPMEYLLLASIEEWTLGSSRSSIKPPYEPKRSRKLEATVRMAFRIVDAQTGQLLFATAERATIPAASADDPADTPLGRAAQACIYMGTHRLVRWFRERPWTGVVSAVEGDRAIINVGSDLGLAAGMVLDVLARGKRLLDPESGLTMGSVTERIGHLKVVAVEKHASEATIIEGCEELEPGARVELPP